jgi:ubiquitin carboxyl-terminal hydrolase 14
MVKATVKWGKETFEVDIDPAGTGMDLKGQLLSLTAVPVERQKLMSKAWAGILKDDTALSSCKLAEGMVVQLMGSAEGVAKPVAAAKFVEDMPQSEVAKLGHVLPTGLVNGA